MTTASPGTDGLVGDRYVLEALIGRGGMGEVWRARHVALKTLVAIKFLHGASEPSERARRRFLNEAQLTANLRSRHAVQVFDFGVTDDGRPYLVMELLEGETLDKRIARHGRLPLATTSFILQKAARALERAHALGIVHRDFKPENIMLVADEEDGGELVKVVDFGIAKLVVDLDCTLKSALSNLAQMRRSPSASVPEVTSGGFGTPHYMAPEQVQDSPQVGPAADIWAFGVVAYECLTGRRPFDDDSIGKLLLRVLAAEPPTPASSFAPVPALFDDWFRVACAREPGARFPDLQTAASALAVALDTDIVAAAAPIAAPPTPDEVAPPVAPTLSSGAATPSASDASPAEVAPPQILVPESPQSVSPLAETLDPSLVPSPRLAPVEQPMSPTAPPPVSAPKPLPASRVARALPALGAVAAAALAIVLAVRDAPGRAPAPAAVALAVAPVPEAPAVPPSDGVRVDPAPSLEEPAVATSRPAPEPSTAPCTPPASPPLRRRTSEAKPSAFRLPPLGL